MSLSDDLRAQIESVGAAPKPLGYIVLDHALTFGEHEEGTDARGRRYVRCSPSLLDAVRHRSLRAVVPNPGDITTVGIQGVPVYLRESLPDGWPQNLGRES